MEQRLGSLSLDEEMPGRGNTNLPKATTRKQPLPPPTHSQEMQAAPSKTLAEEVQAFSFGEFISQPKLFAFEL